MSTLDAFVLDDLLFADMGDFQSFSLLVPDRIASAFLRAHADNVGNHGFS